MVARSYNIHNTLRLIWVSCRFCSISFRTLPMSNPWTLVASIGPTMFLTLHVLIDYVHALHWHSPPYILGIPYLLALLTDLFSNFYFNMTHSLFAWYGRLQGLTLPTEFIILSRKEVCLIFSLDYTSTVLNLTIIIPCNTKCLVTGYNNLVAVTIATEIPTPNSVGTESDWWSVGC